MDMLIYYDFLLFELFVIVLLSKYNKVRVMCNYFGSAVLNAARN